MKKVYILSALLSLVTCFTAKADNGKVNVLLLDGQSHEVAMSTVSKLEISGDNILVVDKSGTTVGTYKMEDIDKISLTASTTGIGQVKASAPITIRSNGYTITAEGMTDGKTLEVYTASGKLAGKAVAKGGKATVNAGSLTNGVYVIKAEGQALKMVKK